MIRHQDRLLIDNGQIRVGDLISHILVQMVVIPGICVIHARFVNARMDQVVADRQKIHSDDRILARGGLVVHILLNLDGEIALIDLL